MRNQQTKLPVGPASKPASEIALYSDLPYNIRPTTFRVIEQGGSLLYVHHYGGTEAIPDPHLRLFRSLIKFDHPDGPGDVTVFLVWGTGQVVDLQMMDRADIGKPRRMEARQVNDLIRQWIVARAR